MHSEDAGVRCLGIGTTDIIEATKAVFYKMLAMLVVNLEFPSYRSEVAPPGHQCLGMLYRYGCLQNPSRTSCFA